MHTRFRTECGTHTRLFSVPLMQQVHVYSQGNRPHAITGDQEENYQAGLNDTDMSEHCFKQLIELTQASLNPNGGPCLTMNRKFWEEQFSLMHLAIWVKEGHRGHRMYGRRISQTVCSTSWRQCARTTARQSRSRHKFR